MSGLPAKPDGLQAVVDAAFAPLARALADLHATPRAAVIGRVSELSGDIAHVTGLSDVADHELLLMGDGTPGIALSPGTDSSGVALLADAASLSVGDPVRGTGRLIDVPVGEALLGRVIDPLGQPLDYAPAARVEEHWPIERPAPAIIARAPVTKPLATGIKAVDATIPIGYGQRELILGDRQTGKTAVAVDALIHQVGRGTVGIYCAVGQRGAAVARVIAALKDHGALRRCVVVVAGADTPAGLRYIAPYAATSIGEHFAAGGADVLIVHDDLTRHARTYRELSLLLHRPPGREAYPGDIFHLHARLLERATHWRAEYGGGSLTALPIIETQAQNIAAYIPTNLISITDGQIYLSPRLFRQGQLPAIDLGRSVSRVGGKAQPPVLARLAGPLRLAYAQFEELETFARFGTRLDDDTRRRLRRGRRVRALLRQDEHQAWSLAEQTVALLAVTEGLFDPVPLDRLDDAQVRLRRSVAAADAALVRRLDTGEALSPADRDAWLALAEAALGGYQDNGAD